MTGLTDALRDAVADPPRFAVGDRVRFTRHRFPRPAERITGTISAGPFADRSGARAYRVRTDRYLAGGNDYVHREDTLTHIDVCPCAPDCTAAEGEAHGDN